MPSPLEQSMKLSRAIDELPTSKHKTEISGLASELHYALRNALGERETIAADAAIDMIRGWLKQGCTISATDVHAPILKPQPDSSWIGGLTIQRPPNGGDEQRKRIALLEQWLQWCLDNCDDSPEWNFGTDATAKMRALIRGESVPPPAEVSHAADSEHRKE